MSLRTKFFPAIAASFAFAAFATFASAQEVPAPAEKADAQKAEKIERKGHGRHGEFGKGMHGDKRRGGRMGLRGIELTDAQKEQMRKIHEANRPDEATRQELKTLAMAKRDGTITAEQQERMKTLRSEAREKGAAIRLQIEGILTAEQRQQLETRKLEMQKKKEERRQLRQQKSTTPEKTNDN